MSSMQTKALFLLLGFSTLLIFSFKVSDIRGRAKSHSSLSSISKENKLIGVWKLIGTEESENSEMTVIKLVTDTYYVDASYEDDRFVGTEGGTYIFSDSDNAITKNLEFFTWDSTKVGTSETFSVELKGDKLTISGERDGQPFEEHWERVASKENSPLFGTWRIRERQTEPGKMNTMEWGPRKTLKILSGNRFQWIAYNIETREFSGTGGGTYTAKNGKYEETIEFFSRDPDRVGAKLNFNYEVKDNRWHHKGKSSAGKDIYEIWEKVD